MSRAVRKSRIHGRRDYRDFRHVPWFLAIAVKIGVLYAISVFKRSLLSVSQQQSFSDTNLALQVMAVFNDRD